MTNRRWWGALLLSLITLGGCAGDSIVAPLVPDQVRVTAPKSAIRLGEVVVLSARVGTSEVQVSPQRISWSSANTAVATVDSLGAVTGVSRGQTAITAAVSVEGQGLLRGSAVLQVIGVQSLAIDGVPPSLTVAGTAQLTPRLVVDSGVSGVAVTWSSADPAIATVSASGLVTAVGIGTTTLSASAEGITATATLKVVSNVAKITVLPVDPILVAQSTRQLSAVLTDASGAILTAPTVTWSSADPAVATVNAAGMLSAVSPGIVTITATETSTGKSGSTRVTVVPRVASSVIAPLNPVFYTGQTQLLSVTYFDASGAVLSNRPVIWQSSAPDIATVNRGTGLVTGVSPGVATIVAIDSLSGYAANTQVTIVAPVASLVVAPSTANVAQGAAVQLTATAFDANGVVLTGRPVAWSSANASIATISSLGLVTAVTPGTTIITATVEGRTATATITVTPPPVATVSVAPASVTLAVAASQSMTASAYDATGKVLTGRSVQWSTGSAAVAVISSQGVVTGVAPGTTTVTATVEGKIATATVVVTAPVVATVSVTPNAVSVLQGATQQLTASAVDAAGVPITGRAVTWASGNPSVATVSSQGLVSAVAPGTATVTATVDGKSGTATITVSTVAVAALTIAPTAPSIVVGGSQQLTATAIDGTGAALTGRVPAWTSTDATVATVSATGLVTGVSAGTALVVATLEGKTATATVTVTRPPVATVSIAPASVTLVTGTTQTFSASARDADGTVLTGRAVAWSSSNPSVASISAQGVVTAIASGSVTITALVEGRTATASVTVIPVPVSTVTITPASGSVITGGFVQLSASAFDATGTILTGRTVAWSSGNPAVASISALGGLTALTPGTVTITATVEGRTATAVFTVNPPPVVAVSVSPPSAALTVGGTQQLIASAYDATGAVLTGRVVAWSSATPSIAVVSPQGMVTAISPGTVAVAATVEGITERATITVTPTGVATVSITPASVSLLVGATQSFTATAFDGNGNVLTGRTVTWSSTAPPVATISSSGVLTAVSAGTTTVTATVEGRSATASVTVSPVPVANVRVTPATVSLTVGASQSMTAVAEDASGNALTGRPVAWSSGTPAVATISAQGVVSAVAPGTAVITATVEGKTATSTVTVIAVPVSSVTVSPSNVSLTVGGTQQLTASAYDGNGNTLTGRPVVWSSDTPAIASVSAQGLVTAVAPGVAVITATVEGKAAAASVTVSAVPVAAVSITPASVSLLVGATQPLAATATDAAGNALTGRTVLWSSANPAVATVSAQGVVTGMAAGTVSIVATVEGKTATASITVSLVPVASVRIVPSSASLLVGQTQQLTATASDASGNALTGRVVAWSSANPAVATITAQGVVTAVASGTANITALVEGRSATISVTVTTVPVSSVAITPASASLTAGSTQQFTASAYDGSGAVLTGRPVVWSSDAPAVATMSPQGLLTAVAPGTAVISATVEGKVATATVTVSAVPVASVTVTPSTVSVLVGGTQNFTATAFDGSGNALTGRTVTWTSTTPSVATISATGVLTAVSAGTTTVTATVEGRSATAAVTVSPVPVVNVRVTPATVSLTVGASQSMTAVAEDASGTALTGRPVTWSSGTPAVATISAQGVVTAVAPGTAVITATVEGKTATSTVTVTAVPVSAVTVSPSNVSLIVGATQQVTASAYDGNGNTLTGRPVAWSSNAPAIASVSAQGLVTAVAPGVAVITATVEGKSAAASVTVAAVPVAAVAITPATVSLLVGATQALTASATDAAGNALTGRPVVWSSTNQSVATVTAQGIVTAVSPGTVTINAVVEGRTAAASVTVSALPVASVTVTPTSANLLVGAVQQLTASAFDASGNALTGRAVAWSSTNTAIATVSSQGAVTAVAPGTVNIVATVEGKTATASITVTAVPVATVTVSPTTLSLFVGATQQFTASAYSASGDLLTGRGVVWSSSASTVASITAQGVLTAVAPGTATITATVEGKTASTTVTVSAIPIASVSVSPATATIPAATTQAFIASAFDAAGNPLTGRAVSWSSSNPTVATISAQGVLTALVPGGVVVTATVEGISASATVSITSASVATVTLNVLGALLNVGDTQVLTATVYDNLGGQLLGRTVTWASANPAVATVNSAGVVTAVGVGTTNVTATVEGRTATASVQVTAPVASVVVSPRAANLLVGGVLQLNATSLDAAGAVLARRAVTWVSSAPAIASITSQGLLTGIAPGTATISATVEGQTGTIPVTVAFASVSSVTLTPSSGYLPTGVSVPLQAVLRDVNNTILTDRVIAWATSDPGIASVTTSGVVTASTIGDVTITATSEGRSAAANFAARTGLKSGESVVVTNAVAGSTKYFAVYVPAGTSRLTVSISGGSGDPDLFLFQPGNSSIADCGPFLAGPSEECVMTRPAAGVWLVSVNAYLPHLGTTLSAVITP